MSFPKYAAVPFAACLLMAQAGATTIIQSAGNSQSSEPLGYYAPYASDGLTPMVYAVEWTQNATYTGVDFFANLFTVGSPGTANYALVTAIGPGTSFAADGIARGSVTTPTNPTDVDLFHLGSLGPGTYYLVLDSPVPNTAWQYNYPIQGNYTTAPGVTFVGDQWSYGASINSGYTAGSNFSGTSLPVEFAVTGTMATPEPATFGVIGIGLIGVAVLVWMTRRRLAGAEQGVTASETPCRWRSGI
ncbi:MAG TPA: PEP-CTERM sorting domain-containing protein [Bryobacteraceae bacterium]|nr:PEP-CTERM sorting domain-containing protein [Bryobacteraceae bacterium]